MKTLLFFAGFVLGVSVFADVTPLIERAERAYERGRMEEARETLFRAMRFAEDAEVLGRIQHRLGEINLEMLRSRHPQAESAWVEVRPGDTLGRIAAREGTTVEVLRMSNQIRGDSIRLGQRLKVLQEPFSIRVNKEENVLVLYLGDRFFKAYRVSTGAGANTPEGEFRITDRIVHPDWWHPESGRRIPFGDTDHRIGTHWLGWNVSGFGIHGTDEPERLGESISLGCVRMHNDEVKELHDLIPSGTRVVVK